MREILLLLVVALVAAGIVFGVAVLLTGRDRGMAPAEPDDRSRRLPGDRPLDEEDLTEVRFDTVARGYRMRQVDTALSRVAYDLGYKQELITALEAEVAALREGRAEDADLLRDRRLAARGPLTPTAPAQPAAPAEPAPAGDRPDTEDAAYPTPVADAADAADAADPTPAAEAADPADAAEAGHSTDPATDAEDATDPAPVGDAAHAGEPDDATVVEAAPVDAGTPTASGTDDDPVATRDDPAAAIEDPAVTGNGTVAADDAAGGPVGADAATSDVERPSGTNGRRGASARRGAVARRR